MLHDQSVDGEWLDYDCFMLDHDCFITDAMTMLDEDSKLDHSETHINSLYFRTKNEHSPCIYVG